MFPYVWGNPMIPAFENAKRTAANIPAPDEQGAYTSGMFQTDFPQFFSKSEAEQDGQTVVVYTPLFPSAVLEQFVASANASVLPSRWGEMWRYAAGLYVAHFSTLYLQTYADGSTPQAAATAGQQSGLVASATMGDTSVSYDNGAATAGTERWGAWNLTKYGNQLISMARTIGMAGIYVI